MAEDYIPRLLEYVASLDFYIADRKRSLEVIQQISGGEITGNSLRAWGPAEALASFQSAKRQLFVTFPELKEHYKGTIEEKLV